MRYSVKLLDLKCNAVLSGEESPWGKNDGIRVFFIAFNESGAHHILVSGREWPPPDVVENYSFLPGDVLDLAKYPPLNGPDWEVELDVGETDALSIAVVGINEGLPYVAGGGGPSLDDKATMASFEELAKKMAKEASEEAGEAGMSAAFVLLEAAIEELNKAADCRGVAFAYEASFSLKWLLENLLHQNSKTFPLTAASAARAVHITHLSRVSPGCGAPDYEVNLEISRKDKLFLAHNLQRGFPENGPPRYFEPQYAPCAPEGMASVWPVFHECTITLRPNFYYPTLHPTWQIDGQSLSSNKDTLSLTNKAVELPAETPATSTRTVSVDYEVTTVGVEHRLVLKTHGRDGNYPLEVSLFLRFSDTGPLVLFRSQQVYVVGQGVFGDIAYQEYLACLDHHQREMEKRLKAHAFIGRGTPVERIIRLDHDMTHIARLLSVHPTPVD
jgi:hypothetical protein